jgi:hypothetical protein
MTKFLLALALVAAVFVGIAGANSIIRTDHNEDVSAQTK